MPDQKPASVKVNGTVFKFTLADVEAAASRLVPAHHTSIDGEWYALVGSGLHLPARRWRDASAQAIDPPAR